MLYDDIKRIEAANPHIPEAETKTYLESQHYTRLFSRLQVMLHIQSLNPIKHAPNSYNVQKSSDLLNKSSKKFLLQHC